jgi:circadian clock protein KaiC
MEVKRISTGIVGLDTLFQGGFLANRSYLITGDAGTGKTTACMQFLLSGLKLGEKAVYVTVDERPAEILQSATSLDWDLQTYIQDKSLVILDASPYFSGRAAGGAEKGADLQKIVSDLAAYAKRMQAARLVIDPLTPLILSGDSPARVQELARALIHLLQSNLTTTNLLTSHLPERSDHDLTNGIQEFLAAGVLILRVNQIEDRFVRTLSVKKMRGTAVEPKDYAFHIVKGSGIMLASPELFQLPKEETEKDPVAP